MTTNVFDRNAKCVATDSRWSILRGRRIIYVDDVPFHKIELKKPAVFMFAGSGKTIQAWKIWIRSNPPSGEGMPALDGLSVCVIDFDSGDVQFTNGVGINNRGAIFAGSGASYAFRCWDVNRDAIRAVESAKQIDYFSGGVVKFVKLETGEHNLALPIGSVEPDLAAVNEAILSRGCVMEIANTSGENSPPFKLSELAANDAELQEVRAQLERGEISPDAPCDAMYNEWTEEQKRDFSSVLAKIFHW